MVDEESRDEAILEKEAAKIREPFFSRFDESSWARPIYLVVAIGGPLAGFYLYFVGAGQLGLQRPTGVGLYLAFGILFLLLGQGLFIGVLGSKTFQSWYIDRSQRRERERRSSE